MSAVHVLIGVHVDSAALDLVATLLALHESTEQPFDLVLLVDAHGQAAGALQECVGQLAPVRQLAVPAGGAAAAFNGLAAETADVYVFLENGVRPGPGWLGRLLAALQADAANGLAGPSTNRCWNEQEVAAHCTGTPEALARQGTALAERHGSAWRSLAPLHSLSEFCYAVRKEVVHAVGAADVTYGGGPCWEMDYNARAARAGFRGVWVQAAYVHRAPVTPWRAAREASLLEASKQLYQDRLCGARRAATGEPAPYHASCHGDACPRFAPAAGIVIHRPLPAAAPRAAESLPLISCVMPTRGRPGFVAQSLIYFQRQNYPRRELIIVHEEAADLPPGFEPGPSIRTVLAPPRSSIGAKRDQGAEAAAGELIAHWDDDDWYGEQRLSRQALPLLQGVADISGLADMLFMVRPLQRFWAVTPALFGRLFLEGVSGGTLLFRRSVWQRSGPYPASSLREDADFMAKAMREGARLCRIPGRQLCIYVRHDRNTWKFKEGRYLQEGEWQLVDEPPALAADRAFYFPAPAPAARAQPLVSCIMPTADRRAFVPRAIRHFLAQDYPHRELIIIDDGSESVADLVPRAANIRYLRLERKASIGAKRNLACEMAQGELLAHWDDDDWMAPGWLGSQVRTLLDHAADLCGLDSVYFYSPEARQAWRYVYDGAPPWVCGGTLCYTREYWQRSRFPDFSVGEDNAFVWRAQPSQVAINSAGELYVATVHRHNTSPKATASRRWQPLPAADVERLMVAPVNGRPGG